MRKHYLDNIRWITVLLVVLYHVIFGYAAVVDDYLTVGSFRSFQLQDGVLYLLYPWFMILLFVVSGICSRLYLEKHTVKEFVSSRTRKLLVPSTIGLFVFQWLLGWFSMTLYGAFETMPVESIPKPVLLAIMAVSGTGPLWYIQALWVFSMVLALVRKCEKKGRVYALCGRVNPVGALLLMLPLWACAQILNSPVIIVYRMGVYGFSFFMGYFVFAHEEVLERLQKCWKLLVPAALALGVGYTVFYFGDNFTVEPILNNFFSMAFAWTAVLAIFAFMKQFGNFDTKFSRFMSSRSFGIYVFHYLGLVIAMYFIGYPQALPAWLAYPVAGLAALGGSLVLNAVISRIPVLRWCILGIRKEKNHVQ